MSLKQKKIKFKPRIKLNHNIYELISVYAKGMLGYINPSNANVSKKKPGDVLVFVITGVESTECLPRSYLSRPSRSTHFSDVSKTNRPRDPKRKGCAWAFVT